MVAVEPRAAAADYLVAHVPVLSLRCRNAETAPAARPAGRMFAVGNAVVAPTTVVVVAAAAAAAAVVATALAAACCIPVPPLQQGHQKD